MCDAIGEMAQCTILGLAYNKIGDKGLEALSGVLARGAMEFITFIDLDKGS